MPKSFAREVIEVCKNVFVLDISMYNGARNVFSSYKRLPFIFVASGRHHRDFRPLYIIWVKLHKFALFMKFFFAVGHRNCAANCCDRICFAKMQPQKLLISFEHFLYFILAIKVFHLTVWLFPVTFVNSFNCCSFIRKLRFRLSPPPFSIQICTQCALL